MRAVSGRGVFVWFWYGFACFGGGDSGLIGLTRLLVLAALFAFRSGLLGVSLLERGQGFLLRGWQDG